VFSKALLCVACVGVCVVTMAFMVELLGQREAGRDCPRRAASRRSAAVNGRQPASFGRKRASREAIDGETGVIPCARQASPPFKKN